MPYYAGGMLVRNGHSFFTELLQHPLENHLNNTESFTESLQNLYRILSEFLQNLEQNPYRISPHRKHKSFRHYTNTKNQDITQQTKQTNRHYTKNNKA